MRGVETIIQGRGLEWTIQARMLKMFVFFKKKMDGGEDCTWLGMYGGRKSACFQFRHSHWSLLSGI